MHDHREEQRLAVQLAAPVVGDPQLRVGVTQKFRELTGGSGVRIRKSRGVGGRDKIRTTETRVALHHDGEILLGNLAVEKRNATDQRVRFFLTCDEQHLPLLVFDANDRVTRVEL